MFLFAGILVISLRIFMLICLKFNSNAEKKRTQSKVLGSALTHPLKSGLIRSVARIAQSVEQGIENPRVLGSIPSPGTTI